MPKTQGQNMTNLIINTVLKGTFEQVLIHTSRFTSRIFISLIFYRISVP